jgi:hypothetical protein
MADQERKCHSALPSRQFPLGDQAVGELDGDGPGQIDTRDRQGFAKV